MYLTLDFNRHSLTCLFISNTRTRVHDSNDLQTRRDIAVEIPRSKPDSQNYFDFFLENPLSDYSKNEIIRELAIMLTVATALLYSLSRNVFASSERDYRL